MERIVHWIVLRCLIRIFGCLISNPPRGSVAHWVPSTISGRSVNHWAFSTRMDALVFLVLVASVFANVSLSSFDSWLFVFVSEYIDTDVLHNIRRVFPHSEHLDSLLSTQQFSRKKRLSLTRRNRSVEVLSSGLGSSTWSRFSSYPWPCLSSTTILPSIRNSTKPKDCKSSCLFKGKTRCVSFF